MEATKINDINTCFMIFLFMCYFEHAYYGMLQTVKYLTMIFITPNKSKIIQLLILISVKTIMIKCYC